MSVHGHRGAIVRALWMLVALFSGVPQAEAEPCPTQCPSGKIALGIAGPMTGQSAAFGQQTAKAAQVSVEKLNAAGGLLGFPVALVVGDDRCDRGQSVDVARRHVTQDKIAFVIGPACPAAALTASQIYAEAGVIQFLPTATTVDLTRQGFDGIFRMLATVEQEAEELASYFAREHKGKKLAVVFASDSYGRSVADSIRRSLSTEVAARFESLLDVPGSYDRIAEKLQADPPDAIYMALQDGPSVEFVRALNQHGVKSLLLGGQQLLSQSFLSSARELAEGVQVLAPTGSLEDPTFKRAVDHLNEANIVPDLVALASVAAVQTWAEAVRRAGSGDPKAMIHALRSGDFETAIGRVAFDQRGDRRDIHYSVLTWRDGRLAH